MPNAIAEMEQWRVIPHYDDYEASDMGRVRCLHSKELISQEVYTDGYPQVYLNLINRRSGVTVKVHRAVAMAFCAGYMPHLVVNHMNGIKHDNRAANLEWVTTKQNARHACRTGLNKGKGTRVAHSIPLRLGVKIPDDVMAILKQMVAQHGATTAGERLGVSGITLNRMIDLGECSRSVMNKISA